MVIDLFVACPADFLYLNMFIQLCYNVIDNLTNNISKQKVKHFYFKGGIL